MIQTVRNCSELLELRFSQNILGDKEISTLSENVSYFMKSNPEFLVIKIPFLNVFHYLYDRAPNQDSSFVYFVVKLFVRSSNASLINKAV